MLGSVGEKDDWVVWYRDAVKGGKYGSIGLVRIVLWWLRFYFIKKDSERWWDEVGES